MPDAWPVGAKTRYRLGLCIMPPPTVQARAPSKNHSRWYSIQLANDTSHGLATVQCAGLLGSLKPVCPPNDLAPSPAIPPISAVNDIAAFGIAWFESSAYSRNSIL